MNDAERDAWLREALRHAPDSGALPPRDVSDAILAQARAAARDRRGTPRRHARAAATQPLLAFWNWLARPPVAAGFASVMAATLVGLMWWDRPLDETLPRRPDVASETTRVTPPSAPAPGAAVTAAPIAGAAPEQKQTTAPAATAAPTQKAEQLSRNAVEPPAAAPRGAADAVDALGATPPARRPAPSDSGSPVRDDKVAARSKRERERELEGTAQRATENGDGARERSERKLAAPAPFPAEEAPRAALAAKVAPPAAKKDAGVTAAPRSDAPAATGAAAAPPGAAEPAAAPAAPAPARMRAAPETQSLDRRREDEPARAKTADDALRDVAKRAQRTTTLPANAPELSPNAASPAATPTAQGQVEGARQAQASAFAAAPAATAQARSELAAGQRERPAPLAALLGAIAADPARWSRASANGDAVAMEPAWRDWLMQLDRAAAGEWRAVGAASAAADAEEGATTLRLVGEDRRRAVVRLSGSTVRVDGPAPGEHWQASVPAAVAERLRAGAVPLPR